MRGMGKKYFIKKLIKHFIYPNLISCVFFYVTSTVNAATHISSGALDEIERAVKTGKYEIKFFYKKYLNHSKVIVILGEEYFNNELSFALGKRIISNSYFNLIGVHNTPEKLRKVDKYTKAFAYLIDKSQSLSEEFYPALSQEAKKAYYLNVWNRSAEEKSLIWLMKEEFLDFESNPSQFNSSRLMKVMNKTLRNFLLSLGVKEEADIEKIGIPKLMFEMKKSLFESNLEVIRLEKFDKVSKQLLDLESKICSAENTAVLTFSCITGLLFTFVGKALFPNCVSTSAIYSLCVVSVLGVPYVLSKVLPLDFDSVIASTSGTLAKRMNDVFEFRSYADSMLFILNKAYLKGITLLLKNKYGWEECSLSDMRADSSPLCEESWDKID